MSTLQDQRILITGANGGIGKATSELLLRDGVGHLLMAGRRAERVEAARAELMSSTGAEGARISAHAGFDMLDPDAIRAAVDGLPDKQIDTVFLQAGGWVVAPDYPKHDWRGQQYERTSFQNALGGHAVIAALEARGLLRPGARIVVMGGEGARGVPGMIAPAAFADAAALKRYLQGDTAGYPAYQPVNALGTSKFINALWAQKLAGLGTYEVVWFTPGFTGGTAGTQGLPGWKEFVFQRIAFPVFVMLGQAQWPDTAARKTADAVSGRIGRNGDLLGAPQGKAIGPITDQKPMQPQFSDASFQDAVWEIAVEVGGPVAAHSLHALDGSIMYRCSDSAGAVRGEQQTDCVADLAEIIAHAPVRATP